MNYRERSLGSSVIFLLPSLKLKEPSSKGPSVENRLHAFLMDNFGGYTAQAGNIFGYWREENGRDSYGEHREFAVAVADPARLPRLKEFLAATARELREECIYFRAGETASLIYPDATPVNLEPIRREHSLSGNAADLDAASALTRRFQDRPLRALAGL